jgi:hypothetical protein
MGGYLFQTLFFFINAKQNGQIGYLFQLFSSSSMQSKNEQQNWVSVVKSQLRQRSRRRRRIHPLPSFLTSEAESGSSRRRFL